MSYDKLKKDILELFSLGEDGLTPTFVATAFPEYPLVQIRFAMATLCEEGVLELADGKMRLVGDAPSESVLSSEPSEDLKPQAQDQESNRSDLVPEPRNEDVPNGEMPDAPSLSNLLGDYEGDLFTIDEMPTTFCKPVAFAFEGKAFPVRNWRDLMVELLSALSVNQGNVLLQIAAEEDARPGKRKRYPISRDGSRFIRPQRIEGTDLWVEGTQSANQIKSCCLKVLDRCGVPVDDVVVCLSIPREEEIQRPKRGSRKQKAATPQDNPPAALDVPFVGVPAISEPMKQAPAELTEPKRETNSAMQAQPEPPVPQQPAPSNLQSFDFTPGRAGIRPASSRRIITNNLFYLTFAADTTTGTADNEFELRFVDERGRTLCVGQTARVVDGKASPRRVRFNLSTKPDSGKAYDLIVHENGQPPERIAAHFAYESSVVFASEDFGI